MVLSEDHDDIEEAIQNLEVFEGMGLCQYYRDISHDPSDPNEDPPATYYWKYITPKLDAQPPQPYTSISEITAACRMYDLPLGNFVAMDCPLAFGLDPSFGLCGSTNTGAGFLAAGNALAGSYPSSVCTSDCPEVRDDAVWVVIYLSDGFPNSAFDVDDTPVCPNYTQTWDYYNTHGFSCRDLNTEENVLSPGSRHEKGDLLYDPDDYARDMIDFVVDNGAFVYSIGMPGYKGKGSTMTGRYAPGEAVLRYAATDKQDATDALSGYVYEAKTPSDLNAIFLAIANRIATRINQ
jgi:hypothetical protein